MVNLTAVNPTDRQRRTPPVEVMVDTGAEVSWLPRQVLLDAGIMPELKKKFATADKRIIERDIGYAILTAEGYSTVDEIVFAEESDMSLLGVRTLEGFSVMVDNVGHRFVATVSMACSVVPINKATPIAAYISNRFQLDFLDRLYQAVHGLFSKSVTCPE